MATGVGVAGSQSEKCGSDPVSDDSSESETETEETKAFHRRVSTSKAIKNGVCIKEGFLMKQSIPFQRWKRRYFKLKPRKLYYAKDNKSVIFEEVNLTDLSLAECSPKNVNHSFQLIIPFRRIILCAETRKEMEDWMSALRTVCNRDFYEGSENPDFLSGQHNWYVASHARPTYCNVCREALSGVTSHGLSCEVCKFKAHKRCAVKAPTNCKWTTLASVGKDIIEDADGNITMPHQWLEGNLPVSAKCVVCDKTCGSVLRLQDWRCLWCRALVHTACKAEYPERCPLGICRVSVVPPTALHNIGNDDAWEAIRPVGCSPLLVFVNSKSGDNQGVKFLRRFKQLLNPAQVFDLMNCGPGLGLRMFRTFHPLRILVCGGDGSVSWVLAEIDKLRLHKQCQIGVLPLGTGNDLARVLGWGSVCDDDTQLPQLLEKYERASTKLLDRWSIMTYEGTMPAPRKISAQYDPITVYEDSVVAHLSKILHSDQHSVVISSAKVLCETVKDFIAKVGVAYSQEGGAEDEDSISHKCAILNQKLDLLLQALHQESVASSIIPEETEEREISQVEEDGAEKKDQEKVVLEEDSISQKHKKKSAFVQREALMSRANSLKKAVRQIIEHTERAVDEQNDQTKERQALAGELEGPEIVVESEQSSSEQSKFTLPIFKTTCCEEERPGTQPWNPWGPSMGQSVGAPLKDTLQVTLPTIEGGASADSSPCPSPRSFLALSPSPLSSPCPSPVPPPSDTSGTPVLEIPEQELLARTPSPAPLPPPSSAASRRISSGSTLKRVGNISLPLGAGLALPILPKEKSISTEEMAKREFPIINPLASLPMWPNLSKDSLIGKVLLANSDVLCAAASPLMDVEEISLEGFEEKCVMNNYFGIGLDAKITLEFHNKREEHPEKCRSRTKNLMWYGVLGGKELLQRTFKNLEQRVQLECDGCRIPLPSLQGIVVLNIPSYGGGSNFWGGTKEDDMFYAPAIDDKILEVVAVFGTVQMAASRVINLQHHRIAQCRSVKITIMGDEGVPVQVDGEAWVQPPGYICILHKNRTQVLCRNRQLESSLKMWQEKARGLAPSRSLLLLPLSEEEIQILSGLIEYTFNFIRHVKLASLSYTQIEDCLYPMASETANFMERLFPAGRMIEGLNARQQVSDFVSSVRNLYHESVNFLREKEENPQESQLDEKFGSLILGLETELRKCSESNGVVIFHGIEEEEQKKHRSLFKIKFKKQSKSAKLEQQRASRSSSGDTQPPSTSGSCGAGVGCGTPVETPTDAVPALYWGAEEISSWLDSIQMGEYKENFLKHDIRGSELLDLERRDLKELGITKVGHIKRILQAIKDINHQKQQHPQKQAF